MKSCNEQNNFVPKQITVKPKWANNFEQIRLQHLLVEQVQVVANEVVRLKVFRVFSDLYDGMRYELEGNKYVFLHSFILFKNRQCLV